MSESEEEWITVRRRRGGRSGVSKQLKALAIPVVPLAFDALAEPEERPVQDQSKAKKKKKSKKSKGLDAADEEDEQPTGQPGSAAAKPGASASAKGPATAKSAAVAAAQQSLFAWLLSRLVVFLVMLGLLRAAGSKKKRKQKSQKASTGAAPAGKDAGGANGATTAAAAATAAPSGAHAAKPAVSKIAADSKDKAPVAQVAASKATTAAKPAAAAAAAPAPQQKPTVKAAPAPSAPAAAAATPQKKQEVVASKEAPAAAPPPPAKAAAAKDAAAAAAQATPVAEKPEPKDAATAGAPAVTVAKPSEPPAAKTAALEAAAAPAAPAAPVAPVTPPPPPPPPIKYDADWGRGKFVVQSLPTAHADVVSAVALAGDLAVSAGYDGAVKLWHWPSPGSASGGVAPRLALSRTLVGHSGRVEALAAHTQSRRLASSGRDSTLKVWDLGSEAGGSDARELGSTYVYESVRTLAVDWAGDSGAVAGRVLLGARSGTVLLYSLGAGGGARKVAALRGHEDEVTALRFLGGASSLAVSGSRDGSVRLWDLRQAGEGAGAAAVLTGLCGRVASLTTLGAGGREDTAEQQPAYLVAGDCSSTLKLWDLRFLPSRPGPQPAAVPDPRRLPNSPGFAGDVCPTAGLWHGPRSGVLVSSCIAWWTANKQALEEAPPTAKLPMACLNISAVGTPATTTTSSSSELLCQYQYTVRLGPGVVTCMAGALDETAVLAGGATGTLWAMRLVRGGSAAVAAAERAAAAASTATAAAGGEGGCELEDALVVGAEELSDDEYDEDEEDDTDDEGEE